MGPGEGAGVDDVGERADEREVVERGGMSVSTERAL